MGNTYHSSQLSPAGWYIASYIERIDPVDAYDDEISEHEPWAVWENRILVAAKTPDEALAKTMEHLEGSTSDYENSDGVMLRSSVVGLTSLIPIYDALEDGNEIEWIDHTGDSILDMYDRIRDNDDLEAFRIPESSKKSG